MIFVSRIFTSCLVIWFQAVMNPRSPSCSGWSCSATCPTCRGFTPSATATMKTACPPLTWRASTWSSWRLASEGSPCSLPQVSGEGGVTAFSQTFACLWSVSVLAWMAVGANHTPKLCIPREEKLYLQLQSTLLIPIGKFSISLRKQFGGISVNLRIETWKPKNLSNLRKYISNDKNRGNFKIKVLWIISKYSKIVFKIAAHLNKSNFGLGLHTLEYWLVCLIFGNLF